MAIKRRLLEETVRDDPDAEAFEGWLLERALLLVPLGSPDDDRELFVASGPVHAMALEVLTEWRLAELPGAFRDWLTEGAPSEDAQKSDTV
jgi:hypothetical protein